MHAGPGELMPTPDVALAVRKITRSGSMRIAEAAFSLAGRRRRKVTVVHKANVLRLSDGFLQCVRDVAERHAGIACEERLVDAMAALLIRDPGQFDVIVTTNMFGDICPTRLARSPAASASALAQCRGSLRGRPGPARIGAGYCRARSRHPTSLIESVAMLLSWLAERGHGENFAAAGQSIFKALDVTLAVPACRTRDLGGALGTKAFAARVVANIAG